MQPQFFPHPHHTHRSPLLKRKREEIEVEETPEPDALSRDVKPPPRKRPNTLESGFALLSLKPEPTYEQHHGLPNACQYDGSPPPFLHSPDQDVTDCPTVEMEEVVDELGSPEPEVQDVHMKKSTWYEKDKDRIVVVDLDSDDEETPRSSPEPRDFSISTALLSRLPLPSVDALPAPPETRQLILYRPSPWKIPDDAADESRQEGINEGRQGDSGQSWSEDAMEIEQL